MKGWEKDEGKLEETSTQLNHHVSSASAPTAITVTDPAARFSKFPKFPTTKGSAHWSELMILALNFLLSGNAPLAAITRRQYAGYDFSQRDPASRLSLDPKHLRSMRISSARVIFLLPSSRLASRILRSTTEYAVASLRRGPNFRGIQLQGGNAPMG